MSEEKKVLQVGIIMPISPIDGCTAEHWAEVKLILEEAVESITQYNCTAKIVSEADDVGVIQKRIVQNIYSADIVICDVSCKNANVMFELGMRLAFDKPTVIIKDDVTDYSFDTGIIEHVPYPRDLRFTKMVEFKSKLARKVAATYEDFLTNPDHSTFLKNFGEFKVAALKETAVTPDNLILDLLTEIQSDIALLKRERSRQFAISEKNKPEFITVIRSIVNEFFALRGIPLDMGTNLDKTTRNSLLDAVEEQVSKIFHPVTVIRSEIVMAVNEILKENSGKK